MINPSPFARQAYSKEIELLEHDLLDMASRAENMVGLAVESLCALDTDRAFKVILADDAVDAENEQIEAHCVRLLALQHPTGSDLRVVSTAMKMITDIERVADLAVDIAKIGMKIEKEMGQPGCIDIRRMAEVARSMLRTSIEAYVKRDLAAVQRVAEMEEEVDALYRDYREQLHARMRAQPDDVVVCSWLLLAIFHVERIADHAMNIAERLRFMVAGVVSPAQ